MFETETMFLQMDPKNIFPKDVNESEDRNYGHSTEGTIKKPRKEMGAQRKRTENWPTVLSLGHRVGDHRTERRKLGPPCRREVGFRGKVWH